MAATAIAWLYPFDGCRVHRQQWCTGVKLRPSYTLGFHKSTNQPPILLRPALKTLRTACTHYCLQAVRFLDENNRCVYSALLLTSYAGLQMFRLFTAALSLQTHNAKGCALQLMVQCASLVRCHISAYI